MTSNEIRKDIEEFENSIKNLHGKINNMSNIWKDNKYSELAQSIGSIVNLSTSVIINGRNTIQDLETFDKIESEKFGG